MILKSLPDGHFRSIHYYYLFRYTNDRYINKNDLPTCIYTIEELYTWNSIASKRTRDNDLPCIIMVGEEIEILYYKYNYLYKYNGYAKFIINLPHISKSYKCVNGMCIELLKEQICNV